MPLTLALLLSTLSKRLVCQELLQVRRARERAGSGIGIVISTYLHISSQQPRSAMLEASLCAHCPTSPVRRLGAINAGSKTQTKLQNFGVFWNIHDVVPERVLHVLGFEDKCHGAFGT